MSLPCLKLMLVGFEKANAGLRLSLSEGNLQDRISNSIILMMWRYDRPLDGKFRNVHVGTRPTISRTLSLCGSILLNCEERASLLPAGMLQ